MLMTNFENYIKLYKIILKLYFLKLYKNYFENYIKIILNYIL